MFQNFIPNAAQDMREDVNMLIQHNWAESAAATARQSNERAMERSWDFNSAEALKQRHWTEMMSNTQHQRAVNDLKAAGLNPMLSIMHAGAGSAAGASASGSASPNSAAAVPMYKAGSRNALDTAQSASQIQVNQALEDRTRAEAGRARAETREIEERTPTHAVSIQQMRQNITESIERIEDIRQRVVTGSATATNLAQQTQNLKAVLPQITATIEQLKAQTTQTYILSGKTMAESDEIRQRIKQNLPALQAALQQLEASAKQLDMPRREQESAQHARFQGAFGALLRILNPLNNFLR